MGVVYRSSLRTTRLNAVETDIDSGAGAATLEIGTAGFASVLATFTLSDPAGTVSGDVLTFSGMPKSTTAGNTGAAAALVILQARANSYRRLCTGTQLPFSRAA